MSTEESMRCEEVKEVLPAYATDRNSSLAVRRHLARCSSCRAELARYEQINAGLARLAHAPIEPPSDLLVSLEAIPRTHSGRVEELRGHLVRNRTRYARGAAVAAAAALAGAALWRTRDRRLATA